MQNTAAMTQWTKQFRWLLPFPRSSPGYIVSGLDPPLALVLQMQKKTRGIVPDIPDGKYQADKEIEFLWQEGQKVLDAGSDAVAPVLTKTTYSSLASPSTNERLRTEPCEARVGKEGGLGSVGLIPPPYLVRLETTGPWEA
ncbi:hypothetical protein BJ875DRAFT_484343 [Amylocarpus encephaloides]|uniref:Uncharacterized protein n=1 Tax=Amylocarpus encephaloides TaxID=45428 RepID=A0A9P7YIT7_9HELO|nr:hypothetical protein BJ875DRAFT_484343 [Amylocarpus encephaloides]